MLTFNKTTNVTGVSTVESGGKQVQAAYMNASINVNGAFNSTHSIQNKKVFEENKEEVLSDFSAFDAYVYQLAGGSDMKTELDVAAGGVTDAETVLSD